MLIAASLAGGIAAAQKHFLLNPFAHIHTRRSTSLSISFLVSSLANMALACYSHSWSTS